MRSGSTGSGRRPLLAAGAGALAGLAGRPARAQPLRRPVRIGYLNGGRPGEPSLGHFIVGLTRLGWAEGRDYVIKASYADFDPSRLAALVGGLLRDGIDVLVCTGATTRVTPLAERSVPVVFTLSGDPVAMGIVGSLARPGGNATGNTQLLFALAAKRLEFVRELLPSARRTAVIQSPDHPGEEEERRATRMAADQLGLELTIRQVRDRAELESALAGIEAAGCDSLICFTDPVTLAHRQQVIDHASRARLPAVYPRRDYCEDGGLLSYGPSMAELTARLAYFVERIAGGARAGDLPVEQPTAIELVLNRRTARALGLELPPTLLARADEVIE